jgi:hypothetical protein
VPKSKEKEVNRPTKYAQRVTEKEVEERSMTPLADALEKTRRDLKAARTPAYGDALGLVKRLELRLAAVKEALGDSKTILRCPVRSPRGKTPDGKLLRMGK